jgi:aryl-alcohol dehydrogenase-like predicted oxidoreductase
MELRPLAHAPFSVSAVGLGCNNFGREGTVTESQEGTRAVINAALDAGVTFFDTADIYGGTWGLSESLMREPLGARRDEAIIATKFGHSEVATPLDEIGAKGSPEYIGAACHASRERLGVEIIDLFQIHTPDVHTPIAETLGALNELREEGHIRAYGCSQFTAAQLIEANAVADQLGVPRFATSQDQLSLAARGAEIDGRLDAAVAGGQGYLPFFPLHNGLFTGKFTRTERPGDTRIARIRPQIADEADWDAMEAYQALCNDWGLTMLEATFGWFLAKDAIASVIAGATRQEQVTANARAGDTRLSNDQVAAIERLFPASAA